jgi:non-ribosomal peptide synthetase-like protein
VSIGANAFVGDSSLVDINTTMEDDTQLAHASCLLDGQRIPKGKRYHGTPARETTSDFYTVEPAECSRLRRLLYPLVLLVPGLVFIPVPVMIAYWLYPHFFEFIGGNTFNYASPLPDVLRMVSWMAPLTLALFLFYMLRAFVGIGAVPRLLNLFLKPGQTYVLYGFHYFLQQRIARATNSAFFNRVFGDSSAIVFYARWMGYDLNEIVQTGSNFGEEQFHDNPHLCDIGSGTMVSDGLTMSNMSTSNTSFTLGKVKIGRNNYLGNYVYYPSEGKTGDNCLLGTMVMVPVDGPVRENVGLLGSPCFEIPRAVSRDRRMAEEMDEATRKERLREKNRYNLMTAVYFLAKTWVLRFVVLTSALLSLVFYQRYGLPAVIVAGYVSFAFAVLWGWYVERLNMDFGWLSPQTCLVLDKYYWFHERHWHLFGLVALANAFAGTPMKNLFSRLQGVRLGKRVFDDGVVWTEYSLIEVGDYVNLNQQAALWPHSLEEGVFKSDRIKIGANCTVGSGSLVHYGVTMGDQVVLDPGSYLMKGEILSPNTRWRGNPAKAVAGSAICDAGQGRPAASPASRAA